FKTGYEWRRQESDGFNDPNYQPQVTLQSSATPGSNPIIGLDNTNPDLKSLTTAASTTARNLLADLSGSVSRINQAFGIVSRTNPTLVTFPHFKITSITIISPR